MIPADVTAKARAALGVFRDDRADVSRQNPDTLEDELAHAALPCHLSQSARVPAVLDGAAGTVEPVYTVYFDPDADIRASDLLTVRHQGQTAAGTAGEPFRTDFNLSVRLEGVKVT